MIWSEQIGVSYIAGGLRWFFQRFFLVFVSRKLGKDCRLRTDIFRKKAVATAIDGIVLAQNDH